MAVRKLKPVESNDGSYAGLVLAKFDEFSNPVMTICFQDHGQDFLEWDLDKMGVVVGCRPYQSKFWCGMRVIAPERLKPGSYVDYISPHGSGKQRYEICYPVISVVKAVPH